MVLNIIRCVNYMQRSSCLNPALFIRNFVSLIFPNLCPGSGWHASAPDPDSISPLHVPLEAPSCITYSRFEFYAFYKHVYCYFEYTPEYTRKDGVEPPFISTGPGVRACSSPMPSAKAKQDAFASCFAFCMRGWDEDPRVGHEKASRRRSLKGPMPSAIETGSETILFFIGISTFFRCDHNFQLFFFCVFV